MTLSRLGAFVFVARLGSVKAAAHALGVSEPAVSPSLARLRRHLGDPLLTRVGDRMVLTEGGRRLHVVMDAVPAEYVAGPLVCLFTQRKQVEATSGVAGTQIMRAPDDGIPRDRFRPPVHVSIWS